MLAERIKGSMRQTLLRPERKNRMDISHYRVLKSGERHPIAQGYYRDAEDVKRHVKLGFGEVGTFHLEREHRGKWFPVEDFIIIDNVKE